MSLHRLMIHSIFFPWGLNNSIIIMVIFSSSNGPRGQLSNEVMLILNRVTRSDYCNKMIKKLCGRLVSKNVVLSSSTSQRRRV